MIALHIAIQNLLAARRRTMFLGAALFLVTFLMVILMSLTEGIRDSLVRATISVSSGHVNVGGFYKTTPSDVQSLITRVDEIKAVVKETLPEARVIDRSRGWGKIISDHGTVQAGINGIDLADEAGLLEIITLAPERDYRDKPALPEKTHGDFMQLKKDGIILFAGQAKRLKVEVGDAVTLRTETMKGQANTADVTVTAIARDLGPLTSWATFVTKETTRELYQWKPDVSGAVQVYFADETHSKAGMDKLRAAMLAKGFVLMDHGSEPFWMKLFALPQTDWVGQKYDVTTWEDEAAFLMYILTGISSLTFLLLSLLTFIIAVGIMNTMYIAVRERTKEIGTLRAIGMGRSGILKLFILEALALGIVSTTAGAIAGMITAVAVDAAHIVIDVEAVRAILLSDYLHLAVKPGDAVLAVIGFTFIAGASAFLPSFRASRIAPVTAMQSVD